MNTFADEQRALNKRILAVLEESGVAITPEDQLTLDELQAVAEKLEAINALTHAQGKNSVVSGA